ncbi:hypothetical protein NP493_194g06000 [Ridgeia piscesae]|uniref:Uncharacterized protein n=1 Tax=Ridgeia piscesae TaxID=27915 RepID=A0AAD9UER8_RIDPI|nr:hypothetical protein NP493_194g06000 [Ridgeia piscesae]
MTDPAAGRCLVVQVVVLHRDLGVRAVRAAAVALPRLVRHQPGVTSEVAVCGIPVIDDVRSAERNRGYVPEVVMLLRIYASDIYKYIYIYIYIYIYKLNTMLDKLDIYIYYIYIYIYIYI